MFDDILNFYCVVQEFTELLFGRIVVILNIGDYNICNLWRK